MTPKAPQEALIAPVDPELSHDVMDVLMGDVISFEREDYGIATHVLIGCPQDIGVQRNHGRPGAADAPDVIRRFLYKLKPPKDNSQVRLLDLGNITASEDLPTMHDALREVVEHALQDGKTVMVLGGGNDISYPDAWAVSKVHPGFIAINVDAHLDMRKSDLLHSGTPYRNLLEGGHIKPANFHEVGIQPWANSAEYLEDAKSMGVNIHTLSEVQAAGSPQFFYDLLHQLEGMPLFVGLDMDSVRASDAPGVSAPSPVGFSAADILNMAARCRSHGRTAVFEITEVNPAMDVDDRTSRLAALTLYTFMYGQR